MVTDRLIIQIMSLVRNSFEISNSTGNYTLTITATDTGAPAKLSRQASAAGEVYGLGVKPATGIQIEK